MWQFNNDWESIGLTSETFLPVLGMLKEYGFIENVTHMSSTRFAVFGVSPAAVQAVREIEANIEAKKVKSQEGKDYVESLKLTLKRHPATAWTFIIITAIGFLAVLVHNVMAVLQDFHIIDR